MSEATLAAAHRIPTSIPCLFPPPHHSPAVSDMPISSRASAVTVVLCFPISAWAERIRFPSNGRKPSLEQERAMIKLAETRQC